MRVTSQKEIRINTPYQIFKLYLEFQSEKNSDIFPDVT